MNQDFKELQEFLKFIFDLPQTYVDAYGDGKLDFTDVQHVWPLFTSARAGISGLGNPFTRLKSLNEEERFALKEYAKARFDLPNDEAEMLIEEWFDLGVKAAELTVRTLIFIRPEPAPEETEG